MITEHSRTYVTGMFRDHGRRGAEGETPRTARPADRLIIEWTTQL